MAEPFEPGTLLPDDLPDGMDLVRAGRRHAAQIPEVQLRYARERAVASDRAYKEHCRGSGVLTTYIKLGLTPWAKTRGVRPCFQARRRDLGYVLHRGSLIPDRRMGLPPDLRERALGE